MSQTETTDTAAEETPPTIEEQISQLQAHGKIFEAAQLKLRHGSVGKILSEFQNPPVESEELSDEQLAARISDAQAMANWGEVLRLKALKAGLRF